MRCQTSIFDQSKSTLNRGQRLPCLVGHIARWNGVWVGGSFRWKDDYRPVQSRIWVELSIPWMRPSSLSLEKKEIYECVGRNCDVWIQNRKWISFVISKTLRALARFFPWPALRIVMLPWGENSHADTCSWHVSAEHWASHLLENPEIGMVKQCLNIKRTHISYIIYILIYIYVYVNIYIHIYGGTINITK